MDTSQRRSGGAVGFLVVMELGSGMLQGWLSPLLTAIGAEYGVSSAALNWVSAMYLLGTAVCVPIIAKLGDVHGHRRLLAVAAALVAAGSLTVALAPNFAVFLAGRALQAPLAAFLPLEFAIVRNRDERRTGRSIGFLVAALTFGAALGSAGSGLLYDATHDLHLVLAVPAVFIAACVPVVLALVPETTVRRTGGVDWLGGALLGAGLLALLGGVSRAPASGWTDLTSSGGVLLGLLLLAAWVAVERRTADPLVDLHLITRGGIGLPLFAAFLFGAELYGSQTPSFVWVQGDPRTLGYGLGLGAGAAGGVILVYALAAFAGTVVADPIVKRRGPLPTLTAGGLAAAACFGLQIAGSGSGPLFAAALALGAVGNGVVLAALPAVIVRAAPADSVGIASALYNTARTVAGAVAGAVFALVMSAFVAQVTVDGRAVRESTPTAFFVVWTVCAVLTLAMVGLVRRFRLPAGDARPGPADRAITSEETV
ncbi:MFS transporter [Dactylosporangium sp. CA-092794]|uniref:MFS transporter n=1 Tax=Dactylosporangium sp. CA-092794 TaxID=3239929 RepID=UPI003D90B26B